jgi:hypothetical protein
MSSSSPAKTTLLENPFEAILESEHPWDAKDIGSNSISVSNV